MMSSADPILGELYPRTTYAVFLSIVIFGGPLVYAWWKRSLAAAIVACLLIVLFGVLWQPWLVFVPPVYVDPHMERARAWGKVLAVVWALFLVGGVGSLVALIQLRRL